MRLALIWNCNFSFLRDDKPVDLCRLNLCRVHNLSSHLPAPLFSLRLTVLESVVGVDALGRHELAYQGGFAHSVSSYDGHTISPDVAVMVMRPLIRPGSQIV